jgi:hypothetical protein
MVGGEVLRVLPFNLNDSVGLLAAVGPFQVGKDHRQTR